MYDSSVAFKASPHAVGSRYRRPAVAPSDWFSEYILVPYLNLMSSLDVGEDVRDLARCNILSAGIEGVLRSELWRYAGWPPDTTTDGTSIDFCVRTHVDTLDVAGMTWIDFGGARFPSRAQLRRNSDGSVSVTAFVGNVDPTDGSPPRLPSGTMILVERDDDGRHPVAQLLLGRRQVPIEWTQVFEIPGADFSAV